MKLTSPTHKDYRFIRESIGGVDQLRRMKPEELYTEENCFTVTFRMGTTTEDDRRESLRNERAFQMLDGEFTALDRFNPADERRLEIMLTLNGTDLLDDSGKPLEFVDVGSIRRVKYEAQFNIWYGAFPEAWSKLLHDACREMNPGWGDTKSP